ncbi:hypothetical protein GWI33_007633 [Rhynchophorus ferrugineus]|uniref:Uncharacterized protein n=1 Tax=Rhynchophorus ferrugineus TaxID=354439 RepID=A0A834MGJ0_RHYFE|nr:hypothetical protein GWI33_007633 [Rhynchophorus ferrugineus]
MFESSLCRRILRQIPLETGGQRNPVEAGEIKRFQIPPPVSDLWPAACRRLQRHYANFPKAAGLSVRLFFGGDTWPEVRGVRFRTSSSPLHPVPTTPRKTGNNTRKSRRPVPKSE